MTAEIAIMNKSAVALAADSAVTVSRGGRTDRIYKSANKIFTLSKYHPVGVMVYGAGEFMAVPWETIIKCYREALGNEYFDTLEQHADHLVGFLDGANPLITDEMQKRYVLQVATILLSSIRKQILESAGGRIEEVGEIKNDAEVLRIAEAVIREKRREFERAEANPGLPPGYARTIVRKYAPELQRARKLMLPRLPLTRRAVADLEAFLGNAFYRNVGPFDSGVVVVGFGKKDTFPALKAFEVQGVVARRLKAKPRQETRISPDRSAAIVPFAQDDVVVTFMEGASPSFVEFEEELRRRGLETYQRTVLDALGNALGADRPKREGKLKREAEEWLKKAQEEVRKWSMQNYWAPVVATVGVLPKDQLAEVAEALVSLTSLKRRVTAGEEESVGGPVDVAVISKGDGFIWIKRKHYFSMEFNPHFTARYFKRETHGED